MTCALAPERFPEYAVEIGAACAGYAASQVVQIVTADPEPDVIVLTSVSSD